MSFEWKLKLLLIVRNFLSQALKTSKSRSLILAQSAQSAQSAQIYFLIADLNKKSKGVTFLQP